MLGEAPWPPESGYRIRCWEILRRLARRHEVHLLARGSGRVAGAAWAATFASVRLVPARRAGVVSLAQSLVSNVPHHARLFDGPALRAALREQAENCDVIYAHYLYFARALDALGPSRPPVVLDQHNLDHETWDSHAAVARWPQRWWLRRQAELIRRDERR